ncbi:piggyBac transposable element-derived protein 4-like [Dendronephthya gigantea]|uniref:piggyBac transposable element-derived protein 4-like n=1 Tax=Dendronephthya gigantea TaxID=151771 RepID=UPI00106A9138|nr:piggyBac transposable element-derived protein 4-like [Dendronephthya gigantea]
MAEALRMFDSSEEEEDFEGFLIDETVEETRPIAAGTSAITWREIAGESDEEEEDFFGFSDIEVEEIESESESDSEISSDDFIDIFEWKDSLSSVNVEDFTADFGPCHGLGQDATPKDFFDLFFGDEFLDHVVHATISYARSKGDQNFSTDRDEMSAFFGLNILIGINRLPRISLYWDSDIFLGNPGFKTTIPLRRFWILKKYFHISDPRQENATDKLTKIRPLISKLENAFQNAYVPGKNISIDEGLVKFNGRLSFKQYMPKKPNKFGIKVWMLADSDTYYVPRFQVYLGKQQNDNENDAEKAQAFVGKQNLRMLDLAPQQEELSCRF